jgi:hypothetical protein
MNPAFPFYSGASVHPHPGHEFPLPAYAAAGFCAGCSHPRTKCCCRSRECRKEAKELLVQAEAALDSTNEKNAAILSQMKMMTPMFARMDWGRTDDSSAKGAEPKAAVNLGVAGAIETAGTGGMGKAFIGGGCCVHLSIEYTPTSPASNLPAMVFVVLQDSENTFLAWAKQAAAHDGYQIKEGIMTTKPGAHLTVLVLNMTARVRWCEIFSC